MKQKSGPGKAPAEQVLKDIRRQTRRQYSAADGATAILEVRSNITVLFTAFPAWQRGLQKSEPPATLPTAALTQLDTPQPTSDI